MSERTARERESCAVELTRELAKSRQTSKRLKEKLEKARLELARVTEERDTDRENMAPLKLMADKYWSTRQDYQRARDQREAIAKAALGLRALCDACFWRKFGGKCKEKVKK